MHKRKPFTRLMLMAAFLLLGVMIAGCVAPAAAPAEGEDAAMPAEEEESSCASAPATAAKA